ncbi:MAG: alpha/beta fold hydrolase [Rubrivivax sp.]
MDLAFDVAGRGRPVLLLHGLFASAANWRRVAAELARTRRVYSVDLRSHGRSPASADMSYRAMADDVLRLIERESLDRPAVVGHCMGAKVAMALALSTPWAVGRLVAIDAAPRRGSDAWTRELDLGAAPPCGLLQRWTKRDQALDDARFDWSCRVDLIVPSLRELAGFPPLLRYLSTARPLHAIVAAGTGTGAGTGGPGLLGAAAYQPMFPRTRIHPIGGASHWVQVDRPAELVAQLDALLPSWRRSSERSPALSTSIMETVR